MAHPPLQRTESSSEGPQRGGFVAHTAREADRFAIPERLYGRESEIAALLAAFERVVREGAPTLVFVSGYSGIGKSSLVDELRKAIVPQGSPYAAGKFDQYKRDIPYATLALALRGLVVRLLGESETEITRWRTSLRSAMGAHARLIVDLVPELVHIVGEQPPVPELPPQDAQARFESVLRRFLGVFASPEHPLALFFDDLQWLDLATLDLLRRLVTEPDPQPLLLIAAYRDNEVGSSHPLTRTLDLLQKTSAQVEHITLAPLTRDHLTRLIADAMRTQPSDARPLAELIFEKTAGNPFFARTFIAAMVVNGLIAFDSASARWTSKLDRIRARGFTDDVVEFMLARLGRLGHATQRALSRMACLGDGARTDTLAMVIALPEEELEQSLDDAVREGLILRRGDALAFVHDRVQEAAYALIPEADRAEAHLRIGRMLAAQTAQGIEHDIFEIVGQMNRGATLIDSHEERSRLAELNLFAGRRAKGSTAYESALVYLQTGLAILGADRWKLQYRTTFDLELHRAECEFLTGSPLAAEERLASLTVRAQSLPERVAAARLRMVVFTTMDEPERAVEVGLECLRPMGFEWTRTPAALDIQQECDRMWGLLGDRSIEELIDLRLMVDADWRAAMDLLVELVPTAMVASYRNLVDLALLRMATLSMMHGHCDGSAYAFASLNIVLGFRFGEYRAALRFGQLGCDLIEKRGLERFRTGAFANFGIFVVPWTQSMAVGSAMIQRGFDTALATGNVAYTIYCSGSLAAHLLIAGKPLEEVHRQAVLSLAFARKAGFGLFASCSLGELRLIQDLRGLVQDEVFLDDARRGADAFERDLEDGGQRTAFAAAICGVRKMQRCFFSGTIAKGVEVAKQVGLHFEEAPYILHVGDYHFYAALLRAAAMDAASGDERAEHAAALGLHECQIAIWAQCCPENSADRACLVAAEIARTQGRELDAQRLYEEAIRLAKAHGFVQNEAIAHELAARFFQTRGYELIADAYLQQAHALYVRWGAHGKARQLERLHSSLRSLPGAVPTSAGTAGQPDALASLEMCRVVSGEIVFDRLVEKLVTFALQSVGAERGLLILDSEGTLQIVAEAHVAPEGIEVVPLRRIVRPADLAESVLNHSLRTRRHAVLADGAIGSSFFDDEYLRLQCPRSVLCVPVLRQEQFIGALYLEHSRMPNVFSASRIALLELLAAQAAVSLENARLFAGLERELDTANASKGSPAE